MKRFVRGLLCVICLTASSVSGYEITEQIPLGAQVESITYVENGRFAGKVAFMDGWNVCLHDPVMGGYKRLFSVAGLGFVDLPRGISYVSQGPFAGNFLIPDNSTPSTLYLVSDTGSLVGDVHAQGFQWGHAEGATQITSGPNQGKFGLIAQMPIGGYYMNILDLEKAGNEIYAYLDHSFLLGLTGPSCQPLGVAYLPATFPEPDYQDMFAVTESFSGMIYVIGDQGTTVTAFPGFNNPEGLTYISSGPYIGKLFAADYPLAEPEIRNLENTQRIQALIPTIGIGISSSPWSFTWLRDRQQMMFVGFPYTYSSIPMDLVSRQSPGEWQIDDEILYTRFNIVRNISDVTAGGTYYLFGRVGSGGTAAQFGVDLLDSSFGFVGRILLPYTGNFGNFVYVPGGTITDDRFVTFRSKILYSFDANFTDPAMTADMTGKVTNNAPPFCYDPAVKRFYVLDGMVLRVFDASWNQIDQEDLRRIFVRGFSAIARITSGDLQGNIVLMSNGDNELYFLNFECEIALGQLNQEVLAAGLKKGLMSTLIKELQSAKDFLEKTNIAGAINQIKSFQSDVRAQAGKAIPAATAARWLALSADIIQELQTSQ